MWQKHRHVGREVGKFSFVGVIATTVDFVLLNICTIWFHFPLIEANVISATISSVVSFSLNKKLTFSGQRHNYKQTVVRYIIIVGISVYVIQNIVLYILGNHLSGVVDVILKDLRGLGLPHMSTEIVNNNVAKAAAAWLASAWNFLLLRKFVFIPASESDSQSDSSK